MVEGWADWVRYPFGTGGLALFLSWERLHPNSNLEMTKSTKEFVNKGLAWVIVHDLS
jgi:hypothetical protein